jgi:hypothetical protein
MASAWLVAAAKCIAVRPPAVAALGSAPSSTTSVRITWQQQLRIVALGTRDREWPLNDGQIPNPNVVRIAPGTRYHRVEGKRRASRNGPVSDLPPGIPDVTIRDCFIELGHLRVTVSRRHVQRGGARLHSAQPVTLRSR